MASNNFIIEQNPKELIISYKWFTPMAIFMLFFSAIWNSFLIIWYSIDFSDSIVFKLLPLLHVAAGVFVTYYTLTRFLNRTVVKVSTEAIKVKHGPLPWWGNKSVNAKDVEQLYVKQNVNTDRNGQSNYTYDLMMMHKNGRREVLLGSSTLDGPDTPREIEQRIEQFLGVKDFAVDGEFDAQIKMEVAKVSRRSSGNDINPTNITLKDLRKGYVLHYELKSWEVVYEAQYDWTEGRTDRHFQLIADDGTAMVLFLRQDMSMVAPWEEWRLEQHRLQGDGFKSVKEDGQIIRIDLDGCSYLLEAVDQGKAFYSGDSKPVEVSQRLFYDMSKRKSIRFLQAGTQLAAYQGNHLSPHEFADILPAE